ncbi:Hsp70 family protein [Amycolatopsis sp. cg5]|uniref:Hsp70 family protein n=1 Tax=Amycolatopsis sp. cg5 TaxID=3238802 RepID=UPI003525A7C9
MTRSWSIAIDFGTSFTSAAVRTGGTVHPVLFDGSDSFSSQVALSMDGELLTGPSATQFPSRVERVPKRAVASASQVRLHRRTLQPVDLVEAIYSYVAKTARTQFMLGDSEPGRVVLTHPVRWTPGAVAILREGAQRAGLSGAHTSTEPVAAGRALLVDREVEVGGSIAVYDLGGGTFDTAVLQRTKDGFSVIGAPGGAAIGGEDFDSALLELVGHRVGEMASPEVWEQVFAGPDTGRQGALIRQDVVKAKERLSTYDKAEVYVKGVAGELVISKAEYESLIKAKLETTVTELVRTVRDSGVEVKAVYLVGGASQTPLVKSLVSEALPKALIRKAKQPKLTVACGALTKMKKPEKPKPVLKVEAPKIETKPAESTYRPTYTPSTPTSSSSGSKVDLSPAIGVILVVLAVVVGVIMVGGLLSAIFGLLAAIF